MVSPLSGISPASSLSVTAAKLSWAMAGHSWLHGQVPPPWQLWPPGESHSQTTLTPFQCHTQWFNEYNGYTNCNFHFVCLWKYLINWHIHTQEYKDTIQTREQFKFGLTDKTWILESTTHTKEISQAHKWISNMWEKGLLRAVTQIFQFLAIIISQPSIRMEWCLAQCKY